MRWRVEWVFSMCPRRERGQLRHSGGLRANTKGGGDTKPSLTLHKKRMKTKSLEGCTPIFSAHVAVCHMKGPLNPERGPPACPFLLAPTECILPTEGPQMEPGGGLGGHTQDVGVQLGEPLGLELPGKRWTKRTLRNCEGRFCTTHPPPTLIVRLGQPGGSRKHKLTSWHYLPFAGGGNHPKILWSERWPDSGPPPPGRKERLNICTKNRNWTGC